MTGKRRLLFWLLFLGGAAAVALIPEFESSEPTVRPTPRPGGAPTGKTAAPSATLSGPQTAEAPIELRPPALQNAPPARDLFAVKTWVVAPPPPPPAPEPKPEPPPPPKAPPLPFVFLGKLDDGRQLRVFLARGERVYTVAPGDVIDGTYRVESLQPGQMTFVYLPLNQRQSLAVGADLK